MTGSACRRGPSSGTAPPPPPTTTVPRTRTTRTRRAASGSPGAAAALKTRATRRRRTGYISVRAVRSRKKKRDPTFFVVVVSNDTYFFFNDSGLDLTLDTARDPTFFYFYFFCFFLFYNSGLDFLDLDSSGTAGIFAVVHILKKKKGVSIVLASLLIRKKVIISNHSISIDACVLLKCQKKKKKTAVLH